MDRRKFLAAFAALVYPNAMEAGPKEVTYAEAIDMLTEYEIKHQPLIVNMGVMMGATDPVNLRIYLNSDVDRSYRRLALLHELTHIKYRMSGEIMNDHPEHEINHASLKLYRKLFGE